METCASYILITMSFFSKKEEELLVDCVKKAAYYGLSTPGVRRLAYDYVTKLAKTAPQNSWTVNEKAGVDWLTLFLKGELKQFCVMPYI